MVALIVLFLFLTSFFPFASTWTSRTNPNIIEIIIVGILRAEGVNDK